MTKNKKTAKKTVSKSIETPKTELWVELIMKNGSEHSIRVLASDAENEIIRPIRRQEESVMLTVVGHNGETFTVRKSDILFVETRWFL